MTRRRIWLVAAGATAFLVVAGAVIQNQVKVYRARQARAAEERQRIAVAQQRRELFAMLQPVALSNCQLERFGERNDGGYLMCGNLLGAIESGYSYGISGYDKWGCDVSTRFKVPVHQYDCFNTTEPVCSAGKTLFHAECVGDGTRTVEGRLFDSIANQLAKNGDRTRRIVLKIDVEGAEWDSLLATPDETLQRIDQMAVEFHWLQDDKLQWRQDDRYRRLIERLKKFFEIGHVHFNNASCTSGLEPFPTWAYEVLFVNKRLAVVDPWGRAGGTHPLDARNNPTLADCQPPGSEPRR